jgi:Calx-beta domain
MPRKVLLTLWVALAAALTAPAAAQAVEVDAAAARVDEGQGAVFVVREQPVIFATEVTITVTSDEGATPGADTGTPDPQTFTFEPTIGEARQEVTVPVLADGVDEGDESFTVTATAGGSSDTASVTINDRDTTIDVAGSTVGEGGAATVTLTPREAVPHEVRVDYGTVPGTAGTADFAAAAGAVTWAPNDTAPKTFQVATSQDALDEDDESLGVLFASSTASLGAPAVALGITDDDAPPLVGVVPATVIEGDSGSKTVSLLVALSAPSGKTIRVTYRTSDGSADAPGDYTPASGVLTFNPGETAKAATVSVRGDRSAEREETFRVGLESPVNATLAAGSSAANVTIADDDGGPGGITSPPGGDDTAPRVRMTRLRPTATRIRMRVRCPAAERRCRSTISVFNVPSRRSKVRQLRRERRLGRGRFTIRGGRTRTVSIRVSRANRRLLRRGGRVRVRAFAVTRDSARNVGNSTKSATLSFRRFRR